MTLPSGESLATRDKVCSTPAAALLLMLTGALAVTACRRPSPSKKAISKPVASESARPAPGSADTSSRLEDSIPEAIEADILPALAHVANPNLFAVVFEGQLGVAIGSDGTILRSTDGGNHFSVCPTEIDQPLYALWVKGTTVIAAGAQGNLLHSRDGGRHFAAKDSGGREELRAIAEDSRRKRVVVVGDHGIVLSSADGGEHFIREESGTDNFLGHLVYESRTGNLVASGEHGTLLVSTEPGIWKQIPPLLDSPITALEARADGVLLAAAEAGPIFRSADGGGTWSAATVSVQQPTFATDFASDPATGITVAITKTGQILRSVDVANRFEALPVDCHTYLSSVTFDGRRAGFVGVGNDGVILTSDRTHSHWACTKLGSDGKLESIATEPQSGALIAVGSGGQIVRSVDGGGSFTTLKGPIDEYVNAVVLASPGPAIPGPAILAVGPHARIARSTDGGRNFTEVKSPASEAVTFFAAIAHPPSHSLVVGGNGNTLLRSTDAGRTWTMAQGELRSIGALHLHSNGTLFALAIDEGVLRSEDGGMSWSDTDVPRDVGLSTAVTLTSGALVLAGRGGALFRSEDAGKHFSAHRTDIRSDLYHLAENSRTNQVWAVGTRGALLLSKDQGRSFQTIESGTAEALNRLLIVPNLDVQIAVGNRGTIVVSKDAGRSWSVQPAVTSEHLRVIEFDRRTKTFFAAGKGGIILVSKDGSTFRRAFSHTLARFSLATELGSAWLLSGDRLVTFSPLDRAASLGPR